MICTHVPGSELAVGDLVRVNGRTGRIARILERGHCSTLVFDDGRHVALYDDIYYDRMETTCSCGRPLSDEPHERMPHLCDECVDEVLRDEAGDRGFQLRKEGFA